MANARPMMTAQAPPELYDAYGRTVARDVLIPPLERAPRAVQLLAPPPIIDRVPMRQN